MDTSEPRIGKVTRPRLLTPGQVAALLQCNPKTVTRWAKAGKLASIRTLGGHRRFFSDDVAKILRGEVDSIRPPARHGDRGSDGH